MNIQHTSIPSVIERHDKRLTQLTSALYKRLQLVESGSGYLIGDLAFDQGYTPYRNINSAPSDLDYQLLAKAGLLVASGGKSGELVVTTGFPSAVFDFYRNKADDFFALRDIIITYNGDTLNGGELSKVQLTIKHLEIMPEILGCIHAIRKSAAEKNTRDFFVVSLGYGTAETALSTEAGPIARTCLSLPGIRRAVNGLYDELSVSHYLGMKNEHMLNQSFQRGEIVIDRKRKDLTGLRRNQLANYYDEVLSPAFKKAFTDSDFEKANKLYLVGGGALYTELAEFFHREFDGVLEVIVPDYAENAASLGYFYKSAKWCGPEHVNQAVGLDIGNAYTVVATATEKETSKKESTASNEVKKSFQEIDPDEEPKLASHTIN